MAAAGQPWPPAYDSGPTVAAAPAHEGGGSYPPPAWPSIEQLKYTKEAITTLILVLALPWLSWKLLTNPSYVIAGAGRQHIKPAS